MSNINWIFENFKPALDGLTPQVKQKALEIAQQLMKKGGISEEKAIQQAIVEAEEWFYDSEG
ncbi:hypothetical protein [Aequorivita sp. CIP111184]|uniref:hypothetical protein n=1 Tax=Aequorivita sp. CIP111184 TaxID=2211356 RepID=UPI000DBBC1E9|nr:hypothetical protein [Aequorivita sp. CIP111184]SRX55930.1 hypothetical protein AEQU1_02956 [Aequorivita sp. CIP111184]